MTPLTDALRRLGAMSTKTYWVVRNDEGAGLGVAPSGMDPSGLMWYSDRTAFIHLDSRREAEALAAEHGGHVVEVTVTERRVGLRWFSEPSAWFAGGESLCDGDRRVGFVHESGGRWRHARSLYDTLDAAKAAAESAVREGWS